MHHAARQPKQSCLAALTGLLLGCAVVLFVRWQVRQQKPHRQHAEADRRARASSNSKLAAPVLPWMKTELSRVFDFLDVDHDGAISAEDFVTARQGWLDRHGLTKLALEMTTTTTRLNREAFTPAPGAQPAPRHPRISGKERMDAAKAAETGAEHSTRARPRELTNRTFLTFQDIETFPHAGIAGPCLLESDQDPMILHPKQFKSCSVVGAAPSSKGSGAGPEIDSHEKVIRAGICQSGTIRKYATDIGQKIDFCVSFWEWAALDPRARLIMVLKSWKWLDNVPKRRDWNKCHQKMLVTHPDFIKKVDDFIWNLTSYYPPPDYPVEFWQNISIFPRPECNALVPWEGCFSCGCTHPEDRLVDTSSGFYAIAMALELCQEIYVYGFDTDTSADAFYGHLHDNPFQAGTKNEVKNERHAFPLERHIFKVLHHEGRLKLHNSTFSVAKPSAEKAKPRPKPGAPNRQTFGKQVPNGKQSSDYYLVGRGRCGEKPEDELPARMDPNSKWIRSPRPNIEDLCDQTAGCVGFHWNVKDRTALLLNQRFESTCCDTEKHEMCFMKQRPGGKEAGRGAFQQAAKAKAEAQQIGKEAGGEETDELKDKEPQLVTESDKEMNAQMRKETEMGLKNKHLADEEAEEEERQAQRDAEERNTKRADEAKRRQVGAEQASKSAQELKREKVAKWKERRKNKMMGKQSQASEGDG